MKLKTNLLLMAVLPIFVLGLVLLGFSFTRFTDSMYREVEVELTNMAHSIDNTLDLAYPGEYVVYGDYVRTLAKGDQIINDNFKLIDPIKEKTGLDVTIFYGNIRYLTTILDKDGNRLTNTYCTSIVEKEVLNTGVGKLYDKMKVDNVEYFAYYLPLTDSAGKCVGMIAILKQKSEVNALVINAMMPIMLITFLAMVFTAFITVKFAHNLTKDLERLKKFMQDVGGGKLKPDSGFELIERQDEISDMYKSALKMQKSLRELVEWDALTMLENRRSANKLLNEMQKELVNINEPYVLVLGDIDHFKNVNDTYGHEVGDKVLKGVADILKKHMKGKGFASRWGGEEFLLGFKHCEFDKAVEETRAILSLVRQMEIGHDDKKIKVTMSFGVSEADKDMTLDALIKSADEKLYYAKEHGRNKVVGDISGQKNSKNKSKNKKKDEPVTTVDEDILDYIKELNGEENGRADI